MLYEQWRAVASARANELALVDRSAGRRWTFAHLARLSETAPASAGTWMQPRGAGGDFVLDVLAGWREGQVVCPLETGRALEGVKAELPKGIVHVKHTSATTGPARAILFTAAQLARDAANIVQTMGLESSMPNLGVISLAHSYGFSNLVLPLLLHGIPLYLGRTPMPERMRQMMTEQDRWTLPAVPALWRTWMEAGILEERVALAISAGAPLPSMLEREVFARHGLKIHNFYGASECGGIAYDDSDQPRAEDSRIGRPLQGVRVAEGSNGCLHIHSAAVGTGYWPQEDAAILGAGRYVTHDMGTVEHGWVHWRGRAGDLINVAGRKVNPESLEAILGNGPGIEDCLVFGVERPGSRRGEEIVICYVSASEHTEHRCRQWAVERLPAWQVPRYWWKVVALGSNQRGKRSRKEWRERFLRDRTS